MAKRILTRKEVSLMLQQIPTNDTELLELMLDILIYAVEDFPQVNLSKLTSALMDLDEGFSTNDKDTDAFIKSKKYIKRCSLKLWDYVQTQFQNMYE